MPIKLTTLNQDEKSDELSSLRTFSKYKAPIVSADPLYFCPKLKKVTSTTRFQSAVSTNWLTQKLSKQTELGLLDGREAVGLKLFAIKSRKYTPKLSSLMADQVKESSSFSLII